MAHQNDTSSSVAATNKQFRTFISSRKLVRPQSNRDGPTCVARGARVWVRLTCLCRGTPRAARSSLASPMPRDDPCWCDDSISIHSTSRAFSDGFLRSSESGFRSLARLISQAHSTRSLVVVAAEDIEGSRKDTLGASNGSRRR